MGRLMLMRTLRCPDITLADAGPALFGGNLIKLTPALAGVQRGPRTYLATKVYETRDL